MILLKVTKDNIETVTADEVHAGEYKINKVSVEFSEEYAGLTKKAVFTKFVKEDGEWTKSGSAEAPIINNECDIPLTMLKEKGKIILGVYAYSISEDDELELRYSPKSTKLNVEDGSYITSVSDDEITASQFEIYTDAMNKGLDKIDEAVSNFNQKMESGEFTGPQGPKGENGTVDYTVVDNRIDNKLGSKQSLLEALNSKGANVSTDTSITELILKVLEVAVPKEEEHEHTFETTIAQKYKTEDKCCKKKKTCTICGYEEEYDVTTHENVTVTESNFFEETFVCKDCGYTGTRSKM